MNISSERLLIHTTTFNFAKKQDQISVLQVCTIPLGDKKWVDDATILYNDVHDSHSNQKYLKI